MQLQLVMLKLMCYAHSWCSVQEETRTQIWEGKMWDRICTCSGQRKQRRISHSYTQNLNNASHPSYTSFQPHHSAETNSS